MSTLIKRTIPTIITFLVGLIMILEWFFTEPLIKSTATGIRSHAIVILSFMMGFAALKLLLTRVKDSQKILKSMNRKEEQDNNNIYNLLLNAWSILILGLFIGIGLLTGPSSDSYLWLNTYILRPTTATNFAIIIWFLIPAIYRFVRADSKEGTLLVLATLLGLVANTPAILYGIPQISPITRWIQNVVTTSAYRGIAIGAGIGALGLGVRVLLGSERGHLGLKEGDTETR